MENEIGASRGVQASSLGAFTPRALPVAKRECRTKRAAASPAFRLHSSFSILHSQLFRATLAWALVLVVARTLVADDNPTLIGRPAPNFTLRDMSGQEVSLEQFKGQPVLLAFWSTRCAPCCAEAIHLSAFQQKYVGQGLVVLGIDAWDVPKTEVQHFVKAKKLSHRILLDGESVARTKYKLGPIPTTYWIDKQGKIVHQSFGFNEKELKGMEGWIKKIVGRETAKANAVSPPARTSR